MESPCRTLSDLHRAKITAFAGAIHPRISSTVRALWEPYQTAHLTPPRPLNTLSDSARKSLFPRGPGLGLKFLLFATLSVGLMITDNHGEPRLRPVREWTARALQPLLWVTSLPRATLNLGDHFRSREDLLSENLALHQKELELEGRVLRMEALEAENARIRELLSSAASLQTRVLIAEIMGVSQEPYRQIVLNKGERDGVYKGQALVDADGIMGQVIEVNPGSSVALLVTDAESGVPVEINRTGLQTVALGRGDGQTLSLPYLPGNADIKVGDLLVSSGLGGRYPPGYPVGKINELRHPAGENFMEGIAYPTARLNQGHQALLVWAERPAQAAEPESGADHAADAQHGSNAVSVPNKREAAPAAARKPETRPEAKPKPQAQAAPKKPAAAAAAPAKPAPVPETTPTTAPAVHR